MWQSITALVILMWYEPKAFRNMGCLFSFLDIFSWCIGTLQATFCLSLHLGRRRFGLNQEKNKVFLSDMKTITSRRAGVCLSGCRFYHPGSSTGRGAQLPLHAPDLQAGVYPLGSTHVWSFPLSSCCWGICHSTILPVPSDTSHDGPWSLGASLQSYLT